MVWTQVTHNNLYIYKYIWILEEGNKVNPFGLKFLLHPNETCSRSSVGHRGYQCVRPHTVLYKLSLTPEQALGKNLPNFLLKHITDKLLELTRIT